MNAETNPEAIDPLAEVVALLQPAVRFTKIVGAAGRWGVRRAETGDPSYCAVLEGECRMTLQGEAPLLLRPGDFVLVPATRDFSMESLDTPGERDFDTPPTFPRPAEARLGDHDAPVDVRFLIGHCVFGAPDAALLVSLLPRWVHVRGEPRLATLVQLLDDEARSRRPAREVVMARLLEVLLIEALRIDPRSDPPSDPPGDPLSDPPQSTAAAGASPGLVRGLMDTRLAVALRRIHAAPAHTWTVAELAQEAALSRSAFFERFSRALGMAPMAYLLAWRMALAKDLLRRAGASIADVAERVGYSSASTFSVAFARHIGVPPARYAHAAHAARAGEAASA